DPKINFWSRRSPQGNEFRLAHATPQRSALQSGEPVFPSPICPADTPGGLQKLRFSQVLIDIDIAREIYCISRLRKLERELEWQISVTRGSPPTAKIWPGSLRNYRPPAASKSTRRRSAARKPIAPNWPSCCAPLVPAMSSS